MMNKDLYRAQFAQLAPRLAGARLPWLQRTRAVAFERFAELGFPTLRDEDWKYTSVATLEARFQVRARIVQRRPRGSGR
jgi:Fe-S cluster assembly protein SufD